MKSALSIKVGQRGSGATAVSSPFLRPLRRQLSPKPLVHNVNKAFGGSEIVTLAASMPNFGAVISAAGGALAAYCMYKIATGDGSIELGHKSLPADSYRSKVVWITGQNRVPKSILCLASELLYLWDI